jgi:hypothetical protein
LHPLLKEKKILPDYQFGFHQQHSTTEQIHQVANNKESIIRKEILLSCIPGHHANIQQGMTPRITVQNKK